MTKGHSDQLTAFFSLLLLDTSLSDCGNTGQGRPFELL